MNPHEFHPDPDAADDEAQRLSRRRLVQRAMYGVTGLGLGALLVACGDEEDEDDLPEGAGEVEEPDSPELDPEEPGMEAPEEDVD